MTQEYIHINYYQFMEYISSYFKKDTIDIHKLYNGKILGSKVYSDYIVIVFKNPYDSNLEYLYKLCDENGLDVGFCQYIISHHNHKH